MSSSNEGTTILTPGVMSLGMSGASFVALVQMLQLPTVPAAPAPLGIAVIAFSASVVLGVMLAFMAELWSEAGAERLPVKRHWWQGVFVIAAFLVFVVGVVSMLVHIYPGRAAWVAFLIAAVVSLWTWGRINEKLKRLRAQKALTSSPNRGDNTN